MKYGLLVLLIALCGISGPAFAQTVPVRIVSYNLLNFPNGRNDCGSGNVNLPNRSDSLRKIMRYLQPDIFVGCEIQTEAGCDSILTRSLNVFGTTHYQRAAFIPNSDGGDLQNMLFYNSSKLVLKEQRVIPTGVRDINHYILYVADNTLPQHHDTCFIEVFMCHLKAGSASADLSERAGQTALLRTILDGRPQGRHLFVCGDLNTYRSSEVCYQNLVSGGTTFLKDPINAPGNWTSNSSFDYLHTQSPRASGATDCGITGGLDDRFDHILVSQNVMNGANLMQYTASSYKAIGNDGNHYNQSILSGTNSQYPDSVVRALYYTSDHLPVKLDATVTIPTNNGLNLTYSLAGGSCQVGGVNATVIANLGQAPYTYLWDANAGFQTTQTAVNLEGGSYCVTVTDNNGISDMVCFEVPALSTMTGSIFANAESVSCDGSAFVAVSGGEAPYSYDWNDPMNQQTATATNLCAGTYTCEVTDNAGCTVSFTTTVLAAEAGIPEYFSQADFSVYPNPAAENLAIRLKSEKDLGLINVRILSVSGELIKLQTADFSHSDEVSISLADLQNEAYFVELEKEGLRLQKLFIKN